jgi:hypothetical protein
VQKFVQYGVGLVVLGDIFARADASSALRDFVRECNRGRQTWFVRDEEELRAERAPPFRSSAGRVSGGG